MEFVSQPIVAQLGAVPPHGMVLHVPGVAPLHCCPAPPHVELQQTPSTQLPEVH